MIYEKDRPSSRRIRLRVEVPLGSPHSVGTTVEPKHHRVGLSRLPCGRLQKEALDLPVIRPAKRKPLHLGEIDICQQASIQVSELAWVLRIRAGRENVVNVHVAARQINKLMFDFP